MDNGVEVDCGSGGKGWVEEGKGGNWDIYSIIAIIFLNKGI